MLGHESLGEGIIGGLPFGLFWAQAPAYFRKLVGTQVVVRSKLLGDLPDELIGDVRRCHQLISGATCPTGTAWLCHARRVNNRIRQARIAYKRLTSTGWPRSFPVAQFPNPPLLLALAGWLLARLGSGSVHSTGRAVFYVGLSVWAWEELTSGVNWFRRLIGLGGLAWIVSQLAGLIPG